MMLDCAAPKIETPAAVFGKAAVPALFVPMKLSATVFDLVPVSKIVTPWKLLPEITLPVEAVVPPIVLLVAPPKIPIPTLLGKAAVPARLVRD